MNVTPAKPFTLLSSNVAETVAEYNSATEYNNLDRALVSFGSDGTTPITPHRIYEAITTSTGSYPPDSPSDWVLVSASNRWKMFDAFTSSQTTNTGTIEVEIQVSKCDTLGLLNLTNVLTAQIIVRTSTDDLVSDITYDLGARNSQSWSDYFFGDFDYKNKLIVPIPGFQLNSKVEIILTGPDGGELAIGNIVAGRKIVLGTVEYGAQSGILDFSRKETDQFGETTLVERPFADLIDLSFYVEHSDAAAFAADKVKSVLSGLRSKPALYDANNTMDKRDSLIAFGFYRDFNITAFNYQESRVTIEIEGLT